MSLSLNHRKVIHGILKYLHVHDTLLFRYIKTICQEPPRQWKQSFFYTLNAVYYEEHFYIQSAFLDIPQWQRAINHLHQTKYYVVANELIGAFCCISILFSQHSKGLFTFFLPSSILLETKSRIRKIKWQHITTNHPTHSVNISWYQDIQMQHASLQTFL